MDTGLVDIKEFRGSGYKPLVVFEEWRVAVLRFLDELLPENINRMERHILTDEVFILTEGQATLIIGGCGSAVDQVSLLEMKTSDFYNVKKGVWHAIVMSKDAHVVIVENDSTSEDNSEYCNLTSDQKGTLRSLVKKY